MGDFVTMDALYVLIPISLLLATTALVAFIWAAKKGQFADLAAPAERLVLEDFEVDVNVNVNVSRSVLQQGGANQGGGAV